MTGTSHSSLKISANSYTCGEISPCISPGWKGPGEQQVEGEAAEPCWSGTAQKVASARAQPAVVVLHHLAGLKMQLELSVRCCTQSQLHCAAVGSVF